MKRKLKRRVKTGLLCTAAAALLVSGGARFRSLRRAAEQKTQAVFLQAEEILGPEETLAEDIPADMSHYDSYSELAKYRFFRCDQEKLEHLKENNEDYVVFYGSPEDEESTALMPVLNEEAQNAGRSVYIMPQEDDQALIAFFRKGHPVCVRKRGERNLEDDTQTEQEHQFLRGCFAMLEDSL